MSGCILLIRGKDQAVSFKCWLSLKPFAPSLLIMDFVCCKVLDTSAVCDLGTHCQVTHLFMNPTGEN